MAQPSMSSYVCPQLADLLRTRRAVGADGQVFENTTGVSTANNIAILGGLLARFKPKRTLEVGLAFAGSAMLFTAYHRAQGSPPKSHVAMDFRQWDIYKDGGLLNLKTAGLDEYLDFRRERSALALGDLLRESAASFDLIYIDGSHFFDEVMIDAYFSIRLLSPEGLMAFDDSSHPDVRKALRYLDSNHRATLRRIDLSPYHPRGSSFKYRAAVAMGKAQMTAYVKVGTIERDSNLRLVDF